MNWSIVDDYQALQQNNSSKAKNDKEKVKESIFFFQQIDEFKHQI